MAHYEFVIVKNKHGQVRPSDEFLATFHAARRLKVNDTVRFSSPHGQIKVEIVNGQGQLATPFKEPDQPIRDSSKTFTVEKEGQFSFHCLLKGKDDRAFVGWPKHGVESGVDNPVNPPRP